MLSNEKAKVGNGPKKSYPISGVCVVSTPMLRPSEWVVALGQHAGGTWESHGAT